MMEVYLPSLKTPIRTWMIPIKTTVANKYSSPCCAISGARTIAIAAVEELIIPGRPVILAATNPIITAV